MDTKRFGLVEFIEVESMANLAVSDAMRILDVSRNTIQKWIKSGRLKAERVPDSKVDEWDLDPESVEELRLNRYNTFMLKAKRISTPVSEYMKENVW